MPKKSAIDELLAVMARLRAPDGCPWDREQDHLSISEHAIEEVYEMIDAIEAHDDHELAEELGDLLLQIVFHCQLADERGVFDFEQVTQHLVDKLIRRHPHVFGDAKVRSVDAVWAQWEQIKKTEKEGTRHERPSALDGIPKRLPALMRAQKLIKKARKAGLIAVPERAGQSKPRTEPGTTRQDSAPGPAIAASILRLKPKRDELGRLLFELAQYAQDRGWSAEQLVRREIGKNEKQWRRKEKGSRR